MQTNKISVKEIIDRMKLALGFTKDEQLANYFSVNRTTPSGWKTRGSVPINEIMLIAFDHDISLDWLLRGIGPREAPSMAPAVDPTVSIVMEGVGEVPGYVDLPVVDMSSFNSSSNVGAWKMPRAWFDQEGLTVDDTALVVAAGDPMIPAIREGQMVVLDRRPRDLDGIFLVRFKDTGTVRFKRVQRTWDGSLRLSNDNPAYAVDVVPRDDAERIEFLGYCHATWQTVR